MASVVLSGDVKNNREFDVSKFTDVTLKTSWANAVCVKIIINNIVNKIFLIIFKYSDCLLYYTPILLETKNVNFFNLIEFDKKGCII